MTRTKAKIVAEPKPSKIIKKASEVTTASKQPPKAFKNAVVKMAAGQK